MILRFSSALVISLAAWAGAPRLTTLELPPAVVGRAYAPEALRLEGGGRCPLNGASVSVLEGALPEGVVLTPSGDFQGIPRAVGVYEFTVRAANPCASATRSYRLEVRAAPILRAAPELIDLRWAPGLPPPPPHTVAVSGSWEGLPWHVIKPAEDWVRAEPRQGLIPSRESGFEEDLLTIWVDPARLAPGVHQAVLRLAAWRAAGTPTVTVRLTVAPR